MPNAKAPTTIRLAEPVKYLRGQRAGSKYIEEPTLYDIEEQSVEYNARCVVGRSSGAKKIQ
jgi:hypothetical protein